MGQINFLTNYHDGVAVSDKFEIKRIVATTYSLEPEFVYLLMTLTEPVSDYAYWDNLALKKCLQDKERIVVFYQEDKFYSKGVKMDPAFAELIETCCISVKKEEFAFHPKIVLVEYNGKEDKNKVLYRLLVSSRNLTSSDSDETGLVLECNSSTKKPFISTNLSSVIDFINTQEWFYNGKHAEVFFQSGKVSSSFEKIGLDKKVKKIILSPFYNEKLCDDIPNTEFWKVANVHSKLFFLEGEVNRPNYLWLGSANCTYNGLYKNFECIVGIPTEISTDEFRKMFLEGSKNIFSEPDSGGVDSDKADILESIVRKREFKLHISECESVCECKIIFSKEKVSEQIEGFDLEKIEICIVNGDGYKRLNEEELVWRIRKRNLSRNMVIRLADLKTKTSRMLKLELDDESKQLFERINEENRQKSIHELTDPFPAFFNASDVEDEEDEGDDINDSTGVRKNAGQSINNNDGVYEKLVKVYAMGNEGQKILRHIKDIMNNSDNESDKKMVELFPI